MQILLFKIIFNKFYIIEYFSYSVPFFVLNLVDNLNYFYYQNYNNNNIKINGDYKYNIH